MTAAMVLCFVASAVLFLAAACLRPGHPRRRAFFGLALALLAAGLAVGLVKAQQGEQERLEAPARGLPSGGQ
jgi:hypothetical protein